MSQPVPDTSGQRPDPTQLVGSQEAAAALGVRTNTLQVWKLRHPDFPKPLVTLGQVPVYWLPELIEWNERRLAKTAKHRKATP